MVELNIVEKVAAWLVPVLLAITVHEVAHGWVARLFGDDTAMRQGRLTLNPVKHIDPVGTVLVPGLMLLLTPFVFGWAKPVPVKWSNLKRPKRDMALVAAAGPGANLLMGLAWALVLRLAVLYHDTMAWMAEPLIFMGIAGIFVNSILMVLNLVPLPPLDGGRVLTGILPRPMAYRLSRIEPYGFFILLALLATGLLGEIIGPVLAEVVAGYCFVGDISLEWFGQRFAMLT